MATLIDVAALKDRMDAGKRTVLLDVRWVLGDPHGHSHFRQGHIPGAVYVDLHNELADPTAEGQGRHPLPPTAALQRSARAWGINDGDTVVAYDDSGSTAAARLWWLLRDAGFHSVFLLDGGLGAWGAAGHPLAQDEQPPVPGDVVLGHGHMDAITMDEAAEWHNHGILLDARAGERYRGEIEPIDPRAGHIPGALSAPTAGNLGPDGTFLRAAQLRNRFAALGIDEGSKVAVYCGSGVTAAHEIAALEIAGFRAALFPGSFSQWSSLEANPVVTGAAPLGTPGP
ncbi:sulfurtransferase [Arthrobacter sp. FW306-2-2C-D06B]|uniref:sulfurtransferase n=1 Tax=Arthrobacter sp. FW306-2-2C-D06B TaxID=2879618 RepID=UPI001F3F8A44|nr:sulfurtransferase [Arthrobacter sp. FW306-2-2C-D06B]UKA57461.1 sulfurtransferase [Arthrobacter sp. FW306-2-2C-D06B]